MSRQNRSKGLRENCFGRGWKVWKGEGYGTGVENLDKVEGHFL